MMSGISREVGISERRVRAALQRLTDAGLHQYQGWKRCEGLKEHMADGRRAGRAPVRQFSIPVSGVDSNLRWPATPELLAWAEQQLSRNPKWGGDRTGKTKPLPAQEPAQQPPSPVEPAEATPKPTRNLRPFRSFRPWAQRGWEKYLISRCGQTPVLTAKETKMSPTTEVLVSCTYAPSTFGTLASGLSAPGPIKGNLAMPPVSPNPSDPPKIPIGLPDGRLSRSLDRLEQAKAWLGRAYPPFPDSRLVPPVRVPSPPVIPPDLDWHFRANFLVTAVRGVGEQRTGRRSPLMRGLSAQEMLAHKQYPLLKAAADRMADLGIAPAAWLFWSYDQWAEMQAEGLIPKTAGMPRLAWLLSERRLTEHLDWFESSKDLRSAERHDVAPLHRALLQDWARMNMLLLSVQSRAEAFAVLDLIFPDGHSASFDYRMVAAKEQARSMTANLRNAAAAGGVLWTK